MLNFCYAIMNFTLCLLIIADHHGPPRINFWQDPMSPSKWKEEHVSHLHFILCYTIMFHVISFYICLKNDLLNLLPTRFFLESFFFPHQKYFDCLFFRILCIYGILEHCLFGVVLLVVLSFYIYEENKTFEFSYILWLNSCMVFYGSFHVWFLLYEFLVFVMLILLMLVGEWIWWKVFVLYEFSWLFVGYWVAVCYRLFKWLGCTNLWGIQVLYRRQGQGRGTFGYIFSHCFYLILYCYFFLCHQKIGNFAIVQLEWCLCSIYPTFLQIVIFLQCLSFL